MLLNHAAEADLAAITDLANQAYRASGPAASWNSEAEFIQGPRLSESILRDDLRAKPHVHLLLWRDDPAGPLLGTVWLEPLDAALWYLGLLTVRPDLQNAQRGRSLLAAAEAFAADHGALRIRMTVVNVRDTLIAWYRRRGYTPTGESEPFPYSDGRLGTPLRNDLHFIVLEKDLRNTPETL